MAALPGEPSDRLKVVLTVILAERGTEPSELIPASSLSAMIWGGRGWHVILRAVRYTAAVAWMA